MKKTGCLDAGFKVIVRKNYPLWLLIAASNKNKNQRHNLINSMTQKDMKAVMMLMNRFLNKKIKISEQVVKQLSKDKKYLYKFVEEDCKLSARKDILKKRGGNIISTLLPFVAPLIGPVVKPLLNAVGLKI